MTRTSLRKFLLSTAFVLALAGAFVADANAATRPWKTDEQAARYLETRLPSWAGINLHPPATTDEDGFVWSAPTPNAYCINGAYSKREQRTGRQYGERTDKNGELRFRTFSCTLHVDERDFHLYVQTRAPGPWLVSVDR